MEKNGRKHGEGEGQVRDGPSRPFGILRRVRAALWSTCAGRLDWLVHHCPDFAFGTPIDASTFCPCLIAKLRNGI